MDERIEFENFDIAVLAVNSFNGANVNLTNAFEWKLQWFDIDMQNYDPKPV